MLLNAFSVPLCSLLCPVSKCLLFNGLVNGLLLKNVSLISVDHCHTTTSTTVL